nr:hypothetical protein [Tanacetum cinerariifolium]
MQTQTSNTLHNAIMEAGSKDRPLMLAPGWKDKRVPNSDGNLTTTTERVFETYKNVKQDIIEQLNAKAKAVQIILPGIDNNIYSTVDACPNACEMWKAIERLKQESYYSRFYKMMNELIRNQCKVTNHQVNGQFLLQWQRFVTLVKQSQELKTVSYHKLHDILKQHQHEYKQNFSTRSQQAATGNRGKAIVNSPQPIYDQEPSMVEDDDETSKDKEIDKLMALISLSNAGYESKRSGNVAGARETVAYHREKMLLCKQEEAGIQLNAEQADWKDDTDHELEAHYMYLAKIQEASPNAVDSGPIFDTEPEQKIDQNDEDADLSKERELLASLIEKLKCEIDESKNRNKFLETSNKVLIDKLKSEIKYFKNKYNSLELSHNQFKEANNKLSEENDLMYADFKKSQAELKRRDSIEYASEMELECAKV